MRRGGALRVHAALGLLDDELWMLEGTRLYGAHFGDREVLLEDDGNEVVVRAIALDAVLQVVESSVEELGDEAKRGVEVFRLAAIQQKREGRLILGENDAVAVEDEPPRRRHGHAAQAVVLGLALVRLAPEHLMDPVHAGQDTDENPRAPRDEVDARKDGPAVLAGTGRHQVSLMRRRASRRCFQGTRDAACRRPARKPVVDARATSGHSAGGRKAPLRTHTRNVSAAASTRTAPARRLPTATGFSTTVRAPIVARRYPTRIFENACRPRSRPGAVRASSRRPAGRPASIAGTAAPPRAMSATTRRKKSGGVGTWSAPSASVARTARESPNATRSGFTRHASDSAPFRHGGARRDVGLPHGGQDEDEGFAVRVGGGEDVDLPEQRLVAADRRNAADREPAWVETVRARGDDNVARLDGLDRRHILDGHASDSVAFRHGRTSAAPRVREKHAHGCRVVREKLHPRRLAAESDDTAQKPVSREDDAVELEAVGRPAVEERRVEGPARLDGDEARGDGAGRRRRLCAEELEEAPLVLLGVAQAEELGAEPLDLVGQRAVLDAQLAP